MMPQLAAINTEHTDILNMVFTILTRRGNKKQVFTQILVTIRSTKKTETTT